MNPDYITAWNYRKLAVEHHLKAAQSTDDDTEIDSESIMSILDEELKVVSLNIVFFFRIKNDKN